jgi:hypothetical protein
MGRATSSGDLKEDFRRGVAGRTYMNKDREVVSCYDRETTCAGD